MKRRYQQRLWVPTSGPLARKLWGWARGAIGGNLWLSDCFALGVWWGVQSRITEAQFDSIAIMPDGGMSPGGRVMKTREDRWVVVALGPLLVRLWHHGKETRA